MDNAILILFGFYLLEHLALYIGMIINLKKPGASNGEFPTVSVIVAGMNEEENIGACIESLLKTDYPSEKLEIIVMNDRSTDRTKEIMLSYAQNNPVVKYLETDETIGKLKGKTNALAIAIKKSKGEIIFTTDADIIVKPSWIKEMVRYYDSGTGVVNSFTTMELKNTWWSLQSFDWIYLLALASGGNGIKAELSCLGNNMSYRRKAYDEVGGYENIRFSVTEDFMLLHTIRRKTKWKAKFPVNPDVKNDTYPCKDFKELFRQKKRWMRGGLDSSLPGIIVGIIEWATSIVLLFGWIFLDTRFYAFFAVSKIIIDMIFISIPAFKLKMAKVYLYFPLFELYFTVYSFLTPFILLFGGKVIWKEQKL